jgi:micrococcal nuclease
MYTYKALITRVLDGDTFDVSIDLGMSLFTKQRIRLKGIDTPEIFRVFDKEKKAGMIVREFILPFENKEVIIKTYKSRQCDIYGRYLADMYLYDGDLCLNDYMLNIGYAKSYILSKPLWRDDELQYIIDNPKVLKINKK